MKIIDTGIPAEREISVEFGPINDAADLQSLVRLYQTAFAGEPSLERSKCVAPPDLEGRCPGGHSSIWPGEARCVTCGGVPDEPAFTEEQLLSSWRRLAAIQEAYVYLERSPQGLLLAALAYAGAPSAIGERSYDDNEAMRDWLAEFLPERVVYLEEIFADLTMRRQNNLWNAKDMTLRFCDAARCKHFFFRTINDHLLERYVDIFPTARVLLARQDIPDRRHAVWITLEGER